MSKIIFPLDFSDKDEALHYIRLLKKEVAMFKVGLELFYKSGSDWIREIAQKEKIKIFLDLKLHDIPNTVYNAVKNLLDIDPFFITVHIEESEKFLNYVVKKTGYKNFLAVTLLTSLDENSLRNLYLKDGITITDYVIKKAEIALDAGCCGVVCSAKEVKAIKKIFNTKLITVTPGIRLKNNNLKNDDQERIVTPVQAVKNGADYIVIGRPIKNSKEPLEVCKKINQDIALLETN